MQYPKPDSAQAVRTSSMRPLVPRSVDNSHWGKNVFRIFLKNAHEIDVWRVYIQYADTLRGHMALEELLEKHQGMLRKLAWQSCARHSRTGTFEDFYQHAVVGAILAYKRFNEDKADQSSTKLSSYVHFTVSNHLLTSVDEDSAIHCPTQQRGMRAYFAGRYDSDPVRKHAFEIENDLTSSDARETARSKYVLLQPGMLSLDEIYCVRADYTRVSILGTAVDPGALSENDIVSKIDLQQITNSMPDSLRAVYDLVLRQEYTMQQAADKLGIGVDQVRGRIRRIRELARIHAENIKQECSLIDG